MSDKDEDMEKEMIWGMLLHLGSNMWGEWEDGLPKSPEEARKRWPDDKLDSQTRAPRGTSSGVFCVMRCFPDCIPLASVFPWGECGTNGAFSPGANAFP